MTDEEQVWIAAPQAVERVAERLSGYSHRAIESISGWFFDNRVRFRASEVVLLMPDGYLDEPYFDSDEYEEQKQFQSVYGHTHSEEDLKRRDRTNVVINPGSMIQEAINWGSTLWQVGELLLRYEALHPEARISYYGVCLNEGDLARCMAFLPPQSAPPKTSQKASAANSSGRPPASWWQEFAAELAILIHSEGLPDTQETLIGRVQTAFAVQGKEEPSRAAIQPVIREIFARLGPAGKANN